MGVLALGIAVTSGKIVKRMNSPWDSGSARDQVDLVALLFN